MINLTSTLSDAEKIRYAQQIKLDQVGIAGQEKLKMARVLCIGAGGLGAPLLWYLAAAGVGTLGIVDDDRVTPDNLQRQILFQTADIGVFKTQAAQRQLTALNPLIQIELHTVRLNSANVADIVKNYDIIADCSDNFATRYLINDICYQLNKPYVFACVTQTQGQCTLFTGKQGPCLRCLFPQPADPALIADCKTAGVLGVVPGLLGILQATEIMKWLLQQGKSLTGRLLCLDSFTLEFCEYTLQQDVNCALCSLQQPLATLPQPVACSAANLDSYAITATALRGKLKTDDIVLIDVRTATEHQQRNIGGVLMPLSELPEQLSTLNKQQAIVLYCQLGKRSQQALQLFLNAEFKNVHYLQGGIEAWT